jgi:hypothetical protein
MVGVEPRDGYTAEETQAMIDEILEALDARISGIMDDGGDPIEGFPYLNIKGSATVELNELDGAIDITFHGVTPPIPWEVGIELFAHQFTEYLGSSYVVVNDVLVTSTTPPLDTVNYRLHAAKGDPGPGPGGVHGSTHAGNSSDPIPDVTETESGLMSPDHLAAVEAISEGHDHDDLYATITGSVLRIATDPASPATNQVRRNTAGGNNTLEFYDGDSWEPFTASVRTGFTVPKNQLTLDIDNADLADDRSLLIHTTAAGKDSLTDLLEGQQVYEYDTGLTWKNEAASGEEPEWGPLVDMPEAGYTPPWVAQSGAGSLFGALGDGNPEIGHYVGDNTGPFIYANYQGVANIKLARFRLPKALSLSKIWHFPIQALPVNTFKIGIYNSDNDKIYDSGFYTGAANTWGQIATGTLSLSANTDYWIAFSVAIAHATYYYRSVAGNPAAPTVFSLAGPMMYDNIGLYNFASATTTGGVLPAEITPVQYPWTIYAPGFPGFLLEGSAA